jgi:hypothetical protein
VLTKITMRKINNTRIFVNEVETLDEKNHSGAAKTQDIHYSEDKARYKAVTLTYP